MVVAVGDTGGGGREGERMDVGDKKQPSYLDYVQLWLHVMDPSKLKVGIIHTSTHTPTCTCTY